jgi:hypothetical protein
VYYLLDWDGIPFAAAERASAHCWPMTAQVVEQAAAQVAVVKTTSIII